MTLEEVAEMQIWTEIKQRVLEVLDHVRGYRAEEPHIMFCRVYHGKWMN